MDIVYIEKVIDFTKSAFNEMLKTQIKEGTPIVFKDNETTEYSISVSFKGDLEGSLIFSINKKSAVELTKSFIEESEVEDSDIKEVLGEIINKIASYIKDDYKNSENITVSNENFYHNDIKFKPEVSYIQIPFKTNEGNFSIFVGIEEKLKV